MGIWPVGPSWSKITCGNGIQSYLCILDAGCQCLSLKIRVNNSYLAACQVHRSLHRMDMLRRTYELILTPIQRNYSLCPLRNAKLVYLGLCLQQQHEALEEPDGVFKSLVANNTSQLTVEPQPPWLLFQCNTDNDMPLKSLDN